MAEPDKKPDDENLNPPPEPASVPEKPEADTPPAAKPKKEKLDPNVAQRQASDPRASVWVTASAGTGKTKVLTDRVLRLMLGGAAPDQILCITFTRAAAALMTNRIRDELGQWATCDDVTLRAKLKGLTGKKPDEATVNRARQLFATFLDSNGGMKIQTIHSFSQSLLKRFPIESGIPPYFDVMDDQTAAEMLRESQADVLRHIQKHPNTPLARAVHMITPEISEEDFDSLIGEITYRRGQLLSNIDAHGGLEPTIDAVFEYLNAPRNADAKAMLAALNTDEGLNGRPLERYSLEDAASILSNYGTANEREKGAILTEWLEHPEKRLELFPEYKKIFLTNEGTIRKKLTTKSTDDADYALREEAERIFDGLEEISTVNVARGTESILRLTSDILLRYAEKKRALNMLDFDDLVYKANLMMQQDKAAGWVLEKLPGNLKHILVDEAQDTNPDQWQLVGALVQEFFTSPLRQKDSSNTLFVVGDEKQSIFSFQRADPEEFGARKKYFSELVKANGGTWRDVQMEIAFRSSPAITQAVDAVFDNPAASDGLFFKDEQADKKVKHSPFRRGQAGLVELHPVIRAEKKEDVKPWSLPLEMEGVIDPATKMADEIADQIKEWLDNGEMLPSRKRKMIPSDIMILVRRRSDFVEHVIRALKKRDIPVAGADRMSLRDQIVVMDLVALGEFLLFPKDDYKLACVLKSPLIGFTDQQIEDIAIGRTGDLWTSLQQKAADPKASKSFKDAYDYLSKLQDDLNTERPYEFYSSVLMNPCPSHQKSGLYAIYSRLGFEAEDPMVEFLNAVERFEQVHMPSLQGFISWLDAGEAEVKREINLNAETPRVNIMTVHGAKGLEAPVVIMPDTTGIPSDNTRARPKFLWPDAERGVPLWVPRADLENQVFTREREKAELEQDREYRRLLYVAMTRAADRLYVYGAKNGDRLSEKSWYELIRQGLIANLGEQLQMIEPEQKNITSAFNEAAANDNEQPIIRFEVKQTARAQGDRTKKAEAVKTVGIPAWARQAPKADQSRTEKFRPSKYDDSKEVFSAPSPLDGAKEAYHAQLGTVIHQLFEFLPSLPEAERAEAAQKYLAKPVWGITAEDQAFTLQSIITILKDPEFGALFGPNSRAEVSIAGPFDKDGKKQMMSGQIDRLVVDDKTVTIVDFKNSRWVPKHAGGVQKKYVMQLASYRLALQQIYPDKEIKCALLYTRQAKLIPLSAKKMDEAIAEIGLKPHIPANNNQKPKAP